MRWLLVLFGLLATPAWAQGPGVYVRTDCTTIVSPTTETVCWDSTLDQWRYWSGSTWVTMSGASGSAAGGAGSVQISDGSGGFVADSTLQHDTTNNVTTISGIAASLITQTGATYTATVADHIIQVDATAQPVTITLPAASLKKGLMFIVKKTDSSANAVTIAADGSDTIDGDTTAVINSQYTSVGLVADGTSAWLLY